MRFVQGIVAFGLSVFIAGAALAASQRDRDDCYKLNGDPAITACTRIIQDRSESAKERADAYANRCFEYIAKRDPDRAIADCSEAIRLNPKDGVSYNNRGRAYGLLKKDLDRAFADLKEATRLNPKHGAPFVNRGLLYRDSGDRNRAIAEFSKGAELGEPRAREELDKLGVKP